MFCRYSEAGIIAQGAVRDGWPIISPASTSPSSTNWGYLPIAQAGGQLLFHLISRLYERTSIIVTSSSGHSTSRAGPPPLRYLDKRLRSLRRGLLHAD